MKEPLYVISFEDESIKREPKYADNWSDVQRIQARFFGAQTFVEQKEQVTQEGHTYWEFIGLFTMPKKVMRVCRLEDLQKSRFLAGADPMTGRGL